MKTSSASPLQFPDFISIGCGQNFEVMPPITIPTILSLTCRIFNGSYVNGTLVYKDGVLIENNTLSPLITIMNEDDLFGTYTFRVTTEQCGSDDMVSRIFRQG